MYANIYGVALMQHCTRSLLTCLPLEYWLLKTQHSPKNTRKTTSAKQLKITLQTITRQSLDEISCCKNPWRRWLQIEY